MGTAVVRAGAGMHKVPIAAVFIKAKMPYKHGNTLTDQQAWDVAAYINSKPRRAGSILLHPAERCATFVRQSPPRSR